MNKRTYYQVKLMCDSYLSRCGVFTYNRLNDTTIMSQHSGFCINKTNYYAATF